MKIFYYILSIKLKCIAILPFGVIYILSDIMAFLLMRIFRYRRKVVKMNLQNAFPEKDKKEIYKITKDFYRNFADLFFETIKASHISIETLFKRLKIENIEIMKQHLSSGRSLIVCLSHRGNWEWLGLVFANAFKYNGYAIYQPLKNNFFDDYMKAIRGRFRKECLVPAKQTARIILKHKNEPSYYLILSDQSPAGGDIKYQTMFLNQKTPVHIGVEKLSVAFDFPLLYIDIIRLKRGYYKAVITEINAEPRKSKPYEITDAHIAVLEQAIRNQPDNWLWSHIRWKYAM